MTIEIKNGIEHINKFMIRKKNKGEEELKNIFFFIQGILQENEWDDSDKLVLIRRLSSEFNKNNKLFRGLTNDEISLISSDLAYRENSFTRDIKTITNWLMDKYVIRAFNSLSGWRGDRYGLSVQDAFKYIKKRVHVLPEACSLDEVKKCFERLRKRKVIIYNHYHKLWELNNYI